MGTITHKIYKNSDAHYKIGAPLMTPQRDVTFPFEGHNWRFSHTSFDDQGDYLVIYRYDDKGPQIPADDMTLFDALLCSAVSGLAANPSFYDDVLGEHGKESFVSMVADAAMAVATEAYRLARNAR